VDRQATLGGSAHGESYLQDPAPFVGENIGRHIVPSSQGNLGHSLPPNRVSRPPIQAPVTTIKARESWVLLTIEKHKFSLLINTGASISTIPFSPGPRFLQENYCSRHIRPASRVLFRSAFSLLLGRFPFLSLLFNCPRNPYSSARMRPSIQIGGTATFTPRRVLLLAPNRGTSRPHSVDGWTHCGTARTAAPVLIHLKDPSWFPHQKQYPLKPDVKEG
jgi:hypothetical protein